MKQKWFTGILLLLLVSSHSSQGQSVTYSAYDKFDYRSGDYSVVGMTGGLLYTYRSSDNSYFLDAYDDSMNKVATVVLDFFPDNIYQVKFTAYPDKIVVHYQALESNKVVQYAAQLDEKGRLKNKPIMLGSIKTGIFGATKTYFSSAISDNKKLIVVFNGETKGSSLEFDAKWLDDNLTIFNRSHTVFTADYALERGEVNLANDTTLLVAAYTTEGPDNYADQYWLLKQKPNEVKFTPLELPLESRYATGGYVRIDNANNRVYFGGFYSDRKNGSFNGILFATYELGSDRFKYAKFIAFDEQIKKAANSRRPEHAFDNYLVKQLIARNDGGFVMISEVHYITSRTSYNPAMGYYSFYNPYSSTVVREFHYNDIMALSYNADGQRDWSAFIPKEQYSQEDGGMFSSYTLLNSGGTLAFLFNDFNNVRSRIQLATVYGDGKTSMHSFAPEGNDNPDWLPRAGKQVSGRVMIVPCLRKKQLCFARVGF